MTPRIADDFSTLVDCSTFILGDEIPPRDPNNHDEDEDEDEDEEMKSSPTNRRSCANRTMMSSRPGSVPS